MIIRCRLLLQKVNSNVYESILDEEWCDVLNMTIGEFVRQHAYNPPDNNRDDYDIRNYYEGIQSLIRTHEFISPAVYPLYDNSRYVNLLNLNSIVGNQYISKAPIYAGKRYRIVTLYGSDNFLTLGAVTNTVGEIFTASFAPTTQPTMLSTGDGTVLTYGLGYYTTHNSAVKAGVVYTILKGTVTFPVGYADKVTANGVDYYLTGASQNRATDLVLTVGSTFMIHKTYWGVWAGYSILEEISDSEVYFKYIKSLSRTMYTCGGATSYKLAHNRIVKSDFIQLHQQHSRGTAISSPLTILEGNNLIVFNNKGIASIPVEKQFDIYSIVVTYFKRPNQVSLSGNIDCDLDEIVHDEIVRKAVDTVNAAIGSGTWEQLKTETVSKSVV